MSKSERDKGLRGEREVAERYRAAGFTVRGLEGGGDHAIVRDPETGLRIHSEVKRQETARPWPWIAQAAAEAPPGAVPVVHFRRNASAWMVLLSLDDFLGILAAERQESADGATAS